MLGLPSIPTPGKTSTTSLPSPLVPSQSLCTSRDSCNWAKGSSGYKARGRWCPAGERTGISSSKRHTRVRSKSKIEDTWGRRKARQTTPPLAVSTGNQVDTPVHAARIPPRPPTHLSELSPGVCAGPSQGCHMPPDESSIKEQFSRTSLGPKSAKNAPNAAPTSLVHLVRRSSSRNAANAGPQSTEALRPPSISDKAFALGA